jgi:hypothetical protein
VNLVLIVAKQPPFRQQKYNKEMNRPKKLLLFFFRLVFSMSGFANGLDNKTDLYGGEGTGGIGHAIAFQGLLKLGLQTDPMHEFAASGRLGNVGLLS